MLVYCNGEIIEKETVAQILEPGYLFGWGVFETLRAYQGNIPFFSLHLERLNRSLALLGMEPLLLDGSRQIEELLSRNSLVDGYIRITAYKRRQGTGIIIYVAPFGYYPPEVYEKGFCAMLTSSYFDTNSISWQLKSLSYLEKRLAWFRAQGAGKDEALVRNREGFIVGGARSNLFLVKEEEVIIPHRECGTFAGITKEIVRKIILNLGIAVREEKISPENLFSSREAFLTSALLEVMPLVECEGRPIGKGLPGDLTCKILSRYRELTHLATV